MYLNIGADVLLKEDVIGVFDLDTATVSKKTRDTLARAEKNGEVRVSGDDLPRSFVIGQKKGEAKQTVYLSVLSHGTLIRRAKDLY